MKMREKMRRLLRYEEKEILTDQDYRSLELFAKDSNELVRSQTAAVLVQWKEERAKRLLFILGGDRKYLVRTEAYDSLSIYDSEDVEEFLKTSILKEQNNLAKGYAILSWADVAVKLYGKQHGEAQGFLKSNNQGEKSSRVRLSWYYAQYVLGDESCLENIFEFLYDADYHIRYSTIGMLKEFMTDKNYEVIGQKLEQMYKREKIAIVRNAAEKAMLGWLSRDGSHLNVSLRGRITH